MLLSYIIRIITVLVTVWLAIRFLGSFLGKQRWRVKTDHSRRPASKRMVKDPVCGMYLDPRVAIRITTKDGDVFFCTDECRRKYLDGTH